MKIFYSSIRLFLVVLLGTVLSVSCSDDESGCGTPEITRVSTAQNRAETIAGGNMGDFIIIQGHDLCGVQSLLINDVEVDLRQAFITPAEITLQIPRVVPQEVSNQITLTTGGGSVTAPLEVSVPPLVVYGLAANEYALAGETVVVKGANFDLYAVTPEAGKVTFGGVAADVLYSSYDSVVTVVPPGIPDGPANIVVSGTYGDGTAIFPYRDNRTLLISSDPWWGWWGGDYVASGDTPPAISGNYIHVKREIGSWAWTEVVGGPNNVDGSTTKNIPADAMQNPANYLFKFEVNTLKPYSANQIKITLGEDNDASTYLWPHYDTHGAWRTVSIPLNEIVKDPKVNPDGYFIRFLFHGDGALDADMAFDNVRVVPKP
jgi:hypothetical protein